MSDPFLAEIRMFGFQFAPRGYTFCNGDRTFRRSEGISGVAKKHSKKLSGQRVNRRPRRDVDDDFLYELYCSTRTEELSATPWSDDEKEKFLRMQFAAQSAYYREHYTDTTWDILCIGGEPIGRLYVARWENEIRIVDISLLPHARGQGIGTRLLNELIEESSKAKKPLHIHVEHSNPALRLYKRLEFKVIGDTGVYFLMERSCRD